MKINDKELKDVTGGFSERTTVVYTLEYGDCFQYNKYSILRIPNTYYDVAPESYITVERYRFNSMNNVYEYANDISGLMVCNVIEGGYLGKLTNLVRE